MKNFNLIIILIAMAIVSCDKEIIVLEKPIITKNPYPHSEKVKVFDSENLNYAVVTIEAKNEEVLEECIRSFVTMELIYDYPTVEKCTAPLDLSRFEFTYREEGASLRDSLRNAKMYKIHYDFSAALDNHKKSGGGPIGFSCVIPDDDRGFTPFLLSGAPGASTASPLADGFSFTNTGPRATFQVYKYSYVGVLSFDVASGSGISAPYIAPLENQLHYIEALDIIWPYQNVTAAGFWYYQ